MPVKLNVILEENGYMNVRRLPTGEFIGVLAQLFTFGLFVGLDENGYKRRYCYEHKSDAVIASQVWDGEGDPPGPWIKEKPSDRLGPGAGGGSDRGD